VSGALFQTGTLTVASTIVLSWLLTGLATWYAGRSGLVDQPGSRHSHRRATPRGGGAGMIAAFLAASLGFAAWAVPPEWRICAAPGLVAVALLGWWDDHRSLPVAPRLLVQLAVSAWLLVCIHHSVPGTSPALLLAGAVFVVWMTNLYNFMDGSNGMAGLQGVFAASAIAWLFQLAGRGDMALLALLLAGACAGFLPWNLGRARVFMGDVGSLSLGYLFAALLVYGVASGAFSLPAALLVMALFLADATLTLLARISRGERWYNAHRQHVYQRLIAHGWSHGRVALLYQAVNLVVVVPGIGVAVRYPALAWPAALMVALLLACAWHLLTRKFGVLAEAG